MLFDIFKYAPYSISKYINFFIKNLWSIPLSKIVNYFTVLILSFALYLLIVGSFQTEELIAGGVASVVIALICSIFFQFKLKYLNPIRIFWLIIYIPYFIWQMIKANIEIALIVINPKLPIHPGIVIGKTSLKSKEGKMLLANSITLTPGTLTVDIIDDEVHIHCVKIKKEKAEKIFEQFEKFIKRITE